MDEEWDDLYGEEEEGEEEEVEEARSFAHATIQFPDLEGMPASTAWKVVQAEWECMAANTKRIRSRWIRIHSSWAHRNNSAVWITHESLFEFIDYANQQSIARLKKPLHQSSLSNLLYTIRYLARKQYAEIRYKLSAMGSRTDPDLEHTLSTISNPTGLFFTIRKQHARAENEGGLTFAAFTAIARSSPANRMTSEQARLIALETLHDGSLANLRTGAVWAQQYGTLCRNDVIRPALMCQFSGTTQAVTPPGTVHPTESTIFLFWYTNGKTNILNETIFTGTLLHRDPIQCPIVRRTLYELVRFQKSPFPDLADPSWIHVPGTEQA